MPPARRRIITDRWNGAKAAAVESHSQHESQDGAARCADRHLREFNFESVVHSGNRSGAIAAPNELAETHESKIRIS